MGKVAAAMTVTEVFIFFPAAWMYFWEREWGLLLHLVNNGAWDKFQIGLDMISHTCTTDMNIFRGRESGGKLWKSSRDTNRRRQQMPSMIEAKGQPGIKWQSQEWREALRFTHTLFLFSFLYLESCAKCSTFKRNKWNLLKTREKARERKSSKTYPTTRKVSFFCWSILKQTNKVKQTKQFSSIHVCGFHLEIIIIFLGLRLVFLGEATRDEDIVEVWGCLDVRIVVFKQWPPPRLEKTLSAFVCFNDALYRFEKWDFQKCSSPVCGNMRKESKSTSLKHSSN